MKMNGGRCYLQNVYQRRPMTLFERQRGVVRSINGVARPIRLWVRVWRALFFIIAFILVLFFGVGLIASTQEFSPILLAHYFTFAVIWSLCSSALLGWYIKMLGGTRTEAAAGFLAMMGLWLVMMQVRSSLLVRRLWEFVSLTKERRLANFEGLRRPTHKLSEVLRQTSCMPSPWDLRNTPNE